MAGSTMSTSMIAGSMSLEQWRRSVWLSKYRLAQLAGVEPDLVHEAERHDGLPIATTKAEKLCRVLSDHHGRRVRPFDVRGLKLC
jgi:hypothetical protein